MVDVSQLIGGVMTSLIVGETTLRTKQIVVRTGSFQIFYIRNCIGACKFTAKHAMGYKLT